jgi:hypothetical protein
MKETRPNTASWKKNALSFTSSPATLRRVGRVENNMVAKVALPAAVACGAACCSSSGVGDPDAQ